MFRQLEGVKLSPVPDTSWLVLSLDVKPSHGSCPACSSCWPTQDPSTAVITLNTHRLKLETDIEEFIHDRDLSNICTGCV